MYDQVIFDVETKKLFSEIKGDNPGDLGVSLVSVYSRKLDKDLNEIKGEMKSFWEDEIDSIWPLLQDADRIIGFNTLEFDIPALTPYANFPLTKLNHLDMLAVVKESLKKRIGLTALARETLDTDKIDSGVNAVLYWKSGTKENLKKLKKYCESDVLITRDLYDFGLHNGYLKYKDKWNTPRKVKVDFSYTPKEKQTQQEGLF